MYLSSKLRAFTLLECLVALLVIAGSVQVYQGLTTVLVSNVKQVRQQENQDWLLFVQQMEAELEGCQLVKVEGNKLYVKQDNQYVLLYALFMAGIFTLLLQVYLERVVASSRQNQAQIVASQSRLMAEMTMDLVDKEAGAFSFSQGTTTYEVKGKQVIVRVASKGQIKTYRYVKKQDQK